MKILICGASGFIGRHLTANLAAAGHEVICGVRKPANPTDISVDFTRDTTKEAWLPRLNDIDVVINAVGVLRDSKAQPMRLLHEQTPLALFAACQEAGVKRIVQASALGMDLGLDTVYFTSRRVAEAYLNEHFGQSSFTLRRPKEVPEVQAQGERPVKYTVRAEPALSNVEGPVEVRTTTEIQNSTRYLILRPSVIYGEDGGSAKLFRFLARMPIHCLPAGGKQKLQPVHIDDICQTVVNWLDDDAAISQTVDCVGLEATDMRSLLDSYCQQQNHKVYSHISIPEVFVKLAAKAGDFIPASPLCSDTLTMLNAGNIGDPTQFSDLLGKQPRSYRTFISG